MTDAPRTSRGPLITPYRVVISVVLAAAFAIMWVAFTSSEDETAPVATDARVVLVQPEPDSVALRQARILARLADGYTGVLAIDGTEIPEDQLDRREGLGSIGYLPGPGTETGALEPGERCATVIFWRLAESREQSDTKRWCWNVQ